MPVMHSGTHNFHIQVLAFRLLLLLAPLHWAQLLPLSFALHICVLCIILKFSAPLFL